MFIGRRKTDMEGVEKRDTKGEKTLREDRNMRNE